MVKGFVIPYLTLLFSHKYHIHEAVITQINGLNEIRPWENRAPSFRFGFVLIAYRLHFRSSKLGSLGLIFNQVKPGSSTTSSNVDTTLHFLGSTEVSTAIKGIDFAE